MSCKVFLLKLALLHYAPSVLLQLFEVVLFWFHGDKYNALFSYLTFLSLFRIKINCKRFVAYLKTYISFAPYNEHNHNK